MMLMEPISAPVPSVGVIASTGKPLSFSPGASCTKLMDTVVSPRAAALIGPVPLRVYWLMFLCSFFMYSKAGSSPMSWTSVATMV